MTAATCVCESIGAPQICVPLGSRAGDVRSQSKVAEMPQIRRREDELSALVAFLLGRPTGLPVDTPYR